MNAPITKSQPLGHEFDSWHQGRAVCNCDDACHFMTRRGRCYQPRALHLPHDFVPKEPIDSCQYAEDPNFPTIVCAQPESAHAAPERAELDAVEWRARAAEVESLAQELRGALRGMMRGCPCFDPPCKQCALLTRADEILK